MKKIAAFLLIALLAGCAPDRPIDTSNPTASAKWIAYCHKKAGKSKKYSERIQWLKRAYSHAVELGQLSERDKAIPQTVAELSTRSKNLDDFKWALANGGRPSNYFSDLQTYFKYGQTWREPVLAASPEALPIFMSEAIDNYNYKFFHAHAAEFKASGFKIRSPLERSEFDIRYRRFIANAMDEALKKKDAERVIFLVNQMPKLAKEALVGTRTQEQLRDLGDYVFQTLKDEELAIRYLKLGFDLNKINLETISFGEPFFDALRADPDYAIRTLDLDIWNGPMTETDVKFLLTLPSNAWKSLNKMHIDEAVELCIKLDDSEHAMHFIALRAEHTPLDRGAYLELMNWAIKYGNKAVFDFVIKENGKLDVYAIDFGALAYNQKLFEKFAPQIMKKIYYTMDTYPKTDGTTFGRIYEVFKCPNEKAGLFLVHKYDLAKDWTKVTEGRTLLMDVCQAGNVLAARYLIEKRGERINTETGYSELTFSLFGSTRPTEGKLSAIFYAAKSGNPKLIRYLKSRGANVNAQSNYQTTPLMHAVTAGHLEAVKTLIELGANVNAEMNSNLNQTDLRQLGKFEEISTAYHRAKTTKRQDILDVLIKAGARP